MNLLAQTMNPINILQYTHTKITLMHTAHLVKGCIDRSIKTTHAKLLLSAIQKKNNVYEEVLPNLKELL